MEQHIYWNDLSLEGQETMYNSGFQPTQQQLNEEEPIGTINTEIRL